MVLTVKVAKTCMVCNKSYDLAVDANRYAQFITGTSVQDAFPDETASFREQILTGIHPGCWDELTEGLDDEGS